MNTDQRPSSKVSDYIGAHPFAILWVAIALAGLVYGVPMFLQAKNEKAIAEARQIVERDRIALAKTQRQEAETALALRCNAGFPQLAASSAALVQSGKAQAALALIGPCATSTQDTQKIAFIEATKAAADIERLAREKRETALRELTAKAVDKADKARRKREGVSIGMTQDEVVASSWGKPRKVNRTTRANSIREQWVYDGGYLYFQDGILTTVQN